MVHLQRVVAHVAQSVRVEAAAGESATKFRIFLVFVIVIIDIAAILNIIVVIIIVVVVGLV